MIALDAPIALKIPGKVKALHLERLAVVYVRQRAISIRVSPGSSDT
jgi:hypothetical protein